MDAKSYVYYCKSFNSRISISMLYWRDVKSEISPTARLHFVPTVRDDLFLFIVKWNSAYLTMIIIHVYRCFYGNKFFSEKIEAYLISTCLKMDFDLRT